MKAKEIQDLIDFISNSGLAEVKIETDEFKLSIKKHADAQAVRVEAAAPTQAAAPAPAPAPVAANPSPAAPAKEESSNYVEIKSPMIGTFYRTPNPDSDAFVNVGDTVSKGQTVCIIEAMKLFNEIESEVSGKIVKVLVENSQPVEYDQPLFLVDPAG
ncbi:Biotin carboxyl carrier protein of acetyl-CoA carboxylase [Indibacter alkaliphilus LW1]|uniref:Biotin carboxyl carrier protein of acetyl-CoA carboxylase n=1 Tax=Indibacter alkaliphilus (strain CCUG 57479 / KCTC 22604 / LW1) TaxID=1189612 RepID=S2DNC4_INDAL|nr:acetyl-CoA carboxylase biotin carboxyl carrier protein [Indibacter alkaliphilus]EPA00560.1 Biotin carboxyl carrier protein of acetyl-CoA carboxylase [Indibacter alkaliphilus LW1]